MVLCKNRGSLKNEGFTLIELMVVLVITMVLVILVIAGYSEGRPRLAVERTAEGFISDLYRARSKAQSNIFYEKEGEPDTLIGEAYGIYIKEGEDSYFLFADKDDPQYIEEVQIETFVKILKVEPEDGGGGAKISYDKEGNFSFQNESSGSITFAAKDDETIRRRVDINSAGIAQIFYDL